MASSDKERRVAQAGGIAFRREKGRISILLVRAKKDRTIWIFPKGHIEKGETAAEAALRETEEEAGVSGELVAEVGEPLEFPSGKELVSVRYFLIRATKESDETDGREKRWFQSNEAIAALSFENARETLRAALVLVRSGS